MILILTHWTLIDQPCRSEGTKRTPIEPDHRNDDDSHGSGRGNMSEHFLAWLDRIIPPDDGQDPREELDRLAMLARRAPHSPSILHEGWL
jgi:hypothetical protein